MTTTLREIRVELDLLLVHSDEESCFYAIAPQLGVIRDGDDAEQALTYLDDALQIELISLCRKGLLEQHMIGSGFLKEEIFHNDEKNGVTERYFSVERMNLQEEANKAATGGTAEFVTSWCKSIPPEVHGAGCQRV